MKLVQMELATIEEEEKRFVFVSNTKLDKQTLNETYVQTKLAQLQINAR